MNIRATTPEDDMFVFSVSHEAEPLLVEALGASGWTGQFIHSRRSGEEVFAAIPGSYDASSLPTRPADSVVAGDVLVAAFGPHYRDAPPTRVLDPNSGYLHLGIVYGDASRWTVPAGNPPVSVIGHLEGDNKQLERAGIRIRLGGSEVWALSLERGSE